MDEEPLPYLSSVFTSVLQRDAQRQRVGIADLNVSCGEGAPPLLDPPRHGGPKIGYDKLET